MDVQQDDDAGAMPAEQTGNNATPSFLWNDGGGRLWQVAPTSDRIVLRHEAQVLELPRQEWQRDIYVAPHGGGFIIRFSTFQTEIGFVVAAAEAVPFIEYVSRQLRKDQPEPESPASEAPREALFWPKVSPLAVWALACSSVVFLPVAGLIPAVVAVVLLFYHGKRIRKSEAWAHSRDLCTAASIFLAVGLSVNILATWCMFHRAPTDPSPASFQSYGTAHEQVDHASAHPPAPLRVDAMGRCHDGRGSIGRASVQGHAPGHVALAQGIFEGEHNWGLIGAALVVVLLSLSVHEAAHAISAWWLGDDFARRLGRVTLNPLAHIDPFGTVLLPLLLALTNLGVFGWARPVPVRTEVLPNPRRAHILISIAGPASNLLLAAASLCLLLGLGCLVELLAPQAAISNYSAGEFFDRVSATGFSMAPFFSGACTVLKLSFMINLFLAFFNLIPIPPLDGSWVLGHLFPRTIGRLYESIRPYSFLIFLVVLWSDVFVYLLFPALAVMLLSFELLGVCTRF